MSAEKLSVLSNRKEAGRTHICELDRFRYPCVLERT